MDSEVCVRVSHIKDPDFQVLPIRQGFFFPQSLLNLLEEYDTIWSDVRKKDVIIKNPKEKKPTLVSLLNSEKSKLLAASC